NGKAESVIYEDLLTGKKYEQPADLIVLSSYTFNNTNLLLHSEIGEPYDPESQTGDIVKNYCYQVFVEQTGFFEEENFNHAMRSGGLYATFDDYNGDNF